MALTLIVLIMALGLPILTLALTSSLITLLVFTAINLALLLIKKTTPEPEQGASFPIWLPVAGVISSGDVFIFECIRMTRNLLP